MLKKRWRSGLCLNALLGYNYERAHTPPAGDPQLPAQALARGGPPAAPIAPADGDPPAAAAACRLLDGALSRGGGGGGGGGGDLVGRLRDAGALRGSGAANLVAQFSTRRACGTRGDAAARLADRASAAQCLRAWACHASKPVQRSAA